MLATVHPDLPPLTIQDPRWLAALAGVLAMGIVAAWAARAARRGLRQFAHDDRLRTLLVHHAPGRVHAKHALALGALSLVVLALADPQSDPVEREIARQGRDIVFVVDVSRSMLASDLAPNRLDRSKLWIKDLVNNLEGDRVALVAFAGAAVVKCPLTLDRTFFNLTLDELDPGSAPIGGTYIGDAIRKAMSEVFLIRSPDEAGPPDAAEPVRDIVLITDGDDQDSFPVEAAAVAGAAGVRIITIGVGSTGEGAPVPDPDSDGYMQYLGQTVRTAMNPETLADIATATPGGVFLNVGTGEIDLAQVDRDLNAIDARRQTGTAVTVEYQPRYYVPLAAALLLLVLEPLVPARRTRPRTAGGFS
ncbi:MAG: VWA domain-containing protein [Phycisphaerales bacterium JB040]